MQNTVNQHIKSALNCFLSHLVTYYCFGNNSANGLATEILQ